MDRLLDVLKIDFDENIEKYFRDVEVESIKKSKTYNTLNFYLVSYNIIPYNYIKAIREIMANKLLNINVEKERENNKDFINPIKLTLKYKLSDNYTTKLIYEDIRRDLFEELKETKLMYAALFRTDNVNFVDDNTMEVTFVKSKEMAEVQKELINIIKNIFVNRYGKDIEIKVNLVEFSDELKDKKVPRFERLIKNPENSNSQESGESEDSSSTVSYRKKKNGIYADGNILYGRKTKGRFKFVTIPNILYDMDNIEAQGVIYNLRYRKPAGKDFIIYSVFIYDGEGCIEIKFFGLFGLYGFF